MLVSDQPVRLPTFGFARGAIVRHNGGPNMLVVRQLDRNVVCVLCEGDAGGTLRLREFPSDECEQIVATNTPLDPASGATA